MRGGGHGVFFLLLLLVVVVVRGLRVRLELGVVVRVLALGLEERVEVVEVIGVEVGVLVALVFE